MPLKKFYYLKVAPVAAILLLGVLVYSNTFKAPFELDDRRVIVGGTTIKDFSYFVGVQHKDDGDLKEELGYLNRRYAGYLTFALNYRLHGLDVAGYHILNLLIHIANALLVYSLVLKIYETPYFSAAGNQGMRNLTALFSSLIFVCHPVQTQAVTYIVQRFASLATFFYLASMVMYLAARVAGSRRAGCLLYAGSLCAAVAGMKTKEIAVTLPVTIMFCEFLFLKGKRHRRIVRLLPFFLIMLIVPLSMTGAPGSVPDLGGIDTTLKLTNPEGISRSDYLLTEFRVIVTYIRLMFPPVVQNLDYDYPVFHSFLVPQVFLSFLLLLSLAAAGIYIFSRTRRPGANLEMRLVSFGIAWFFVTLSVESGVIPISDVIFEHRMYLPSVGFILALTVSILVAREKVRNRMALVGKAVVPGLSALALIFAGAAYARNSVWKDEVRLWEDTAQKSPKKIRPHYNLALAYFRNNRIPEAIDEFTFVVNRIDFDEAYYNLGVSYFKLGILPEAIKAYQAALKSNPNHAAARGNLGVAYARMGHFEMAAEEFRAVLELKPDDGDALNNLSIVRGELEKKGKTISDKDAHDFKATP